MSKQFKAPLLGELREMLTIQSQVPQVQPNRETTFSWQTVAAVHAKVERINGESDPILGVKGLTRYWVTIRYRTDIKARQRALWDGNTYDLMSVMDPDGWDHWLLLDMQITGQDGT